MIKAIVLVLTGAFCLNASDSYAEIVNFNFYDKVIKSGITPSENSKKWRKKWDQLDLENTNQYLLNEISGTTSVNLKIKKIDSNEVKGYKSLGSFVALNESANPNAELGYYNLSLLTGVDYMFRPTVRYQLDLNASGAFKHALLNTDLRGEIRNANKKRILNEINSKNKVLGCIKAKNDETAIEVDELTKPSRLFSRGNINLKHPLMKYLKANNPFPVKGEILNLTKDYRGDSLTLAHELSILLTFDVVFGQYDRFTGGNIVIEKDENNLAHFKATDNGGAEIVDSIENARMNAKIFSRYDRKLIIKLREFNQFLTGQTTSYYGHNDPNNLIIEMGMYFLKSPVQYKNALIANINVLLNEVHENEEKFGNQIYFEEE